MMDWLTLVENVFSQVGVAVTCYVLGGSTMYGWLKYVRKIDVKGVGRGK